MKFWWELKKKRKLHAKGHVTIPKSFQKELNLQEGDPLTIELNMDREEIIIRKGESR